MKWLLDTNVVSENVRSRPDQAVLAWIAQQSPEQVAISIVTMAELQYGASSARSENDRRKLTEWLQNQIVPSFGDRTLPLNLDVLSDWLQLARKLASKRVSRDAPDLLIAATARVHQLVLVTRNIRDFAETGLIVYDPWSGKTHKMEDP